MHGWLGWRECDRSGINGGGGRWNRRKLRLGRATRHLARIGRPNREGGGRSFRVPALRAGGRSLRERVAVGVPTDGVESGRGGRGVCGGHCKTDQNKDDSVNDNDEVTHASSHRWEYGGREKVCQGGCGDWMSGVGCGYGKVACRDVLVPQVRGEDCCLPWPEWCSAMGHVLEGWMA